MTIICTTIIITMMMMMMMIQHWLFPSNTLENSTCFGDAVLVVSVSFHLLPLHMAPSHHAQIFYIPQILNILNLDFTTNE